MVKSKASYDTIVKVSQANTKENRRRSKVDSYSLSHSRYKCQYHLQNLRFTIILHIVLLFLTHILSVTFCHSKGCYCSCSAVSRYCLLNSYVFYNSKRATLSRVSPPGKTPLPFMFRIIAIGLSLVNTSLKILQVCISHQGSIHGFRCLSSFPDSPYNQ